RFTFPINGFCCEQGEHVMPLRWPRCRRAVRAGRSLLPLVGLVLCMALYAAPATRTAGHPAAVRARAAAAARLGVLGAEQPARSPGRARITTPPPSPAALATPLAAAVATITARHDADIAAALDRAARHLRAPTLGDATSRYAPDIGAALLENGYAANVVSVGQ